MLMEYFIPLSSKQSSSHYCTCNMFHFFALVTCFCFFCVYDRFFKFQSLYQAVFFYQVSDFGLAKIALELDSNTHVSTRVMGTFG
jgi:hypothetical protein